MPLLFFVNLAIFASLLFLLFLFSKKDTPLANKVMVGLIMGVFFGFALQVLYSDTNRQLINATLDWTNVIGNGYINLLKMIVMPLILVSMISAVVQLGDVSVLGKIGGTVIGLLVFTVILASLVAIGVTFLFDLSFQGMLFGAPVELLADRIQAVHQEGFASLITSFVSQNIFQDLANQRDVSMISVVIFAIIAGIAALHMKQDHPQAANKFASAIQVVQIWVMKLVGIVLVFTPFGVMALMTKVIANSKLEEMLELGWFIVASYTAILTMFLVHALLLWLFKVPLKYYFAKVWPVLTFAFTSRSSAATIPLNVETQTKELNVPTSIANVSATFGTTIGQNGCAGIYPTMLSIIVAVSMPELGIDAFSFSFLAMLVAVVAITSFGVAGIGGGGIFSALIVLPIMGLPVEIVAVLISIEPLIDMARTALNVNGAMCVGVITSRILGIKVKIGSEEQPALETEKGSL